MRARGGWLGVIAAAVALAAAAPPASAAFPGANGQLVLAPTSGRGILIASPQSGRAKRVCNGPHSCGDKATSVQFSPNGREVVVAGGGPLQIATTSGACVWCGSSARAWAPAATHPAFGQDGATITYVHHGLWQVTPGTTAPTRLLGASVSAAAWSATGKLVVARRGWLYRAIRQGGRIINLVAITRGNTPAWSPDGRELAYGRSGVVHVIRLAGHKITRVGRGSSPAFSPNGRELAYLNTKRQVTVRPLARGRARTLRRLRGRSLDWQPVTAVTRHGCAAGNGAVVAGNGTATIRVANSQQVPAETHTVWNGCLAALGVPFHLNGGFNGYGGSLTLGQVALAGNYAALQFISTDKMQDYSDAIDVYDLRSGALVHTGAVRCGGFPCDITGLTVNADGFAAWRASDTPHPPESAPASISCPSASLCVAGGGGDVLVSTDPTGGRAAWTQIQLAPVVPEAGPVDITGVSCPTVSFCLAIDAYERVFWSTDPAGGPSAWQTTTAVPIVATFGAACASPSACVALSGGGIYTTTTPTAANSWRPSSSIPDVASSVACPSTTLCVVMTSTGQALSTQDPEDPAPTWTPETPVPGAARQTISSLTCPSGGFCAAVQNTSSGGLVLTTTDPVGGAATWTAHPLTGLDSLACVSTSLCVGFDNGNVVTSTDPSDASPSWTTAPLSAQPSVSPVACPTTSLCVGFARQDAVVSSDPTGGTSAWTSFLVDALPCDPATPCRAELIQALDSHGLETLDTAPQGTGTVISNPTFSGHTVSWTDGGAPRSAALS